MKLALLGRNISHSRSPEIYKRLLGTSVSYELLDFENQEDIPFLEDLFDKYQLDGLNITSPYKKLFFNELQLERPILKEVGGVNCILRRGKNYIGENTDELAFRSEFKRINKKENFESIVILGNGTMASMIDLVLRDFSVETKQFYRSRDGDLSLINPGVGDGKKLLMINACSREFIYRGPISSGMVFWDMNYKMTEHQNSIPAYVDGEGLLMEQARFAVEFFTRLSQ